MVLEKTLESPLESKEIKNVNSKGNQSWILIGRTDAEAEAPVLQPPHGKIEGRRRGRERMRWLDGHHQLNGHESEQTLGDSERQGSLACCSP